MRYDNGSASNAISAHIFKTLAPILKPTLMNFDDIKNELKNPEFNIDLGKFLLFIRTTNLLNSYHLKEILKRQIEILELQKGKTGQELESAVEDEIETLNNKFSELLKDDLIQDVNDSSRS